MNIPRHLRPSQVFIQWLETQIKTLPPGTRCATGPELARQWNLSVSTVRNILRVYNKKGLLTLIPGKGTFIGSLQPRAAEENAEDTQRSSVDTIVDFVLDSISDGSIRKGSALPSIKFMSLQFKVAPSTVIRAYGRLRKKTLVAKIGKTFWVGDYRAFAQPRVRKTVVMFNYGSTDFSSVFIDSWLAPAYRKLEHELLSYGFDITYENISDLDSLMQNWMARKRLPAGFIFFRLNEKRLTTVEEALRHFMRVAKSGDCRILVDWQSGDYTRLPAGVHILSRGNIFTTRARAVAEKLTESGYKNVFFFFDERHKSFDWFLPFLRIRSEFKRLAPNAEFRVVFKPKGSPNRLFARLYAQRRPDSINTLMSKYTHTAVSTLERESIVLPDFADMYSRLPKKSALLFLEDMAAVDALTRARESGMMAPRDIGILSFENNPRHYHEKISCCSPDMERIGYLMAHSLIGDFAVARTSKGFIRVKADILDRGTL